MHKRIQVVRLNNFDILTDCDRTNTIMLFYGGLHSCQTDPEFVISKDYSMKFIPVLSYHKFSAFKYIILRNQATKNLNRLELQMKLWLGNLNHNIVPCIDNL